MSAAHTKYARLRAAVQQACRERPDDVLALVLAMDDAVRVAHTQSGADLCEYVCGFGWPALRTVLDRECAS